MKVLTPNELDDRTDSGKSLYEWIGRKVRLHFGPTGVLVRHKTRKFGVRFQFGPCSKCGIKSDPVFAVSGLHSGAWCYVYDADGKYLGNMRDDNWTCGCQRGIVQEKPFKIVVKKLNVGRGRKVDMEEARTHEGHFIGDPKFADHLVKKFGITRFELRTPKSKVCSVGLNVKTKTWYGWSHRAIKGFKTRAAAARFAEYVS